MKEILDVDNDAFYHQAKSELKIIHIPNYTKIRKSYIYRRLENYPKFNQEYTKSDGRNQIIRISAEEANVAW